MRKIFLPFVVFFSSCGFMAGLDEMPLPQPVTTMVSEEEKLTVSLTREGLYDYGRSRFMESEQFLRRARLIHPEAENIRFNLAVVLEAGDQFEESLQVFTELMESDSLNLFYVEGAARNLYRLDRFSPAKELFERALYLAQASQDGKAVARNARSLSVLNFRIGLEQEALCYSELAMTTLTRDEELYRHLQMLSALHQYNRALSLLDEYGEKRGLLENPAFMPWYALLFLETGKPDRSLAVSHRYLRRHSGGRDENLMKGVFFLALQHSSGEVLQDGGFEELLSEVEDQWDEVRSLLLNEESRIYWPVSFLEQLFVSR